MASRPDKIKDIAALIGCILFTAFFIYKISNPGENAISNEIVRMTLVISGIIFFVAGSIVLLFRILKSK